MHFLHGNCCFSIQISLTFFPMVQLTKRQHWFGPWLGADRPDSIEPKMTRFTYTYMTFILCQGVASHTRLSQVPVLWMQQIWCYSGIISSIQVPPSGSVRYALWKTTSLFQNRNTVVKLDLDTKEAQPLFDLVKFRWLSARLQDLHC